MSRYLLILFATMIALFTGACGSPATTSTAAGTPLPQDISIETAAELYEQDFVQFVDVRTLPEYEGRHIPGVLHIPMNEIPARVDELPADKTIIIQCEVGARSDRVTNYLREQGYENVHNMEGGIVAWEQAGLAVESGAAD